MSTRKTSLRSQTIKRMRKRKQWRTRALMECIDLVTFPVGAPDRSVVEKRVIVSINKIRTWFDSRRANIVINAVQRRAINVFREKEHQ